MARSQPTQKSPSGAEHTARFGALIRERRETLKITQDELALTTGVGRRFILELEAGKPSCQLGKALLVAIAVGLRPFDLMTETSDDNPLLPDLPEPLDEEPSRG